MTGGRNIAQKKGIDQPEISTTLNASAVEKGEKRSLNSQQWLHVGDGRGVLIFEGDNFPSVFLGN